MEREMAKLKTAALGPIYCITIIQRMDLILDTHRTEYKWQAFYKSNACKSA